MLNIQDKSEYAKQRYTGRKECYYFILFLIYFLYLCFYLFFSSVTDLILAYRLCVTHIQTQLGGATRSLVDYCLDC